MQHTFEFGVYTGLTLMEQWTEWFPSQTDWHWRTFNPLKIEFELDSSMGDIEIQIVVLGLGFILRCKYNKDAEMFKEIQDQIKDIKDELDVP